jgi:hypothetical protein
MRVVRGSDVAGRRLYLWASREAMTHAGVRAPGQFSEECEVGDGWWGGRRG